MSDNSTTIRLTVPQRRLLADLAVRAQTIHDRYAPGRRLVALGLATGKSGRYGAWTLTITDAGREAVNGRR